MPFTLWTLNLPGTGVVFAEAAAPEILRDVRTRLVFADDVANLVGERVFPGFLAQGAALPACRLLVQSTLPYRVANGHSALKKSRIRIDCFAERYEETEQLADAIAAAAVMGGFRGTAGDSSVASSNVDNRYDDPDPPDPGTDRWRYCQVVELLVDHN
ncbi:MAG: tail completion protein gp17 [Planctomycetota bacterium]